MSKYRKFTELLDEHLKDKEFAAEFLSQTLEEDLEKLCSYAEPSPDIKTLIRPLLPRTVPHHAR